MDIVEVFSSDSDDNNHSHNSQGRETIATQSHRHSDKTKNIKKKYQPIIDSGKIVKYQENPSQYKRLRKKMQNRESATRVRGRKKNAFENLQQEVQYLRKQNSQLQLTNAKLETENKSLKDQVEFMKSIIKPCSKSDPVEKYLSSEVLIHPEPSPSPPMADEYESPFFEEFNWMRSESSSSQNVGWLGLTIFTIVLAVFILPSQQKGTGTFVAWQASQMANIVLPISSNLVNVLNWIVEYGKIFLKYGLILFYVWVVFGKVNAYLRSRKLKKV